MTWYEKWLEDYQWFLVDLGEPGWYWNLYWKDERVNGGIQESKYDGDEEAYQYAWKHHVSILPPMEPLSAFLPAERT